MPLWNPKNTRASRLLGSDARTSHNPPLSGRHNGKPTGPAILHLGDVAPDGPFILAGEFV